MINLNSKISVGLIWSFIEQIGSKLALLLVQVFLARQLAPDVFGVMAILLVFVNVADVVAQSGLGLACIQRDGDEATIFSSAFWVSSAFAILLIGLIWLLSPVIARFYSMPELEVLLRVVSLVLFFNSINSIQRAYLQKKMMFKVTSVASITAALGAGLIAIIAATAGFGIWALVLQVLCQGFVSCVCFQLMCPWRPELRFDRVVACELFTYGWKVCVTGILATLYTSLSELIIGKTCHPSDLGYYSQGRKWPISVVSMLANSLQNVLLPALSKTKSDLLAFRRMIKNSLRVGTLIVAPVATFSCLAAEPLIEILLGEHWLGCLPVFRSICLANIFLMSQVTNLRAIMALGRSDIYLQLQIIKVVLGTILMGGTAIATRDIVAIGNATAVFLAFSMLVIDALPSKKLFGITQFEQLRIVTPPIAISVVSGVISAIVTPLDIGLFSRLLCCGIVYILSFSPMAYLYLRRIGFVCKK